VADNRFGYTGHHNSLSGLLMDRQAGEAKILDRSIKEKNNLRADGQRVRQD